MKTNRAMKIRKNYSNAFMHVGIHPPTLHNLQKLYIVRQLNQTSQERVRKAVGFQALSTPTTMYRSAKKSTYTCDKYSHVYVREKHDKNGRVKTVP